MSRVLLLAADRPLPLYQSPSRLTKTAPAGEYAVSVEEEGFSLRPNDYYRDAVEELGLSMKPCRYELTLDDGGADDAVLKDYLEQTLRPGEGVELWSLWVPRYPQDRLERYRGRLSDLDREALAPLERWNVCITVEN